MALAVVLAALSMPLPEPLSLAAPAAAAELSGPPDVDGHLAHCRIEVRHAYLAPDVGPGFYVACQYGPSTATVTTMTIGWRYTGGSPITTTASPGTLTVLQNSRGHYEGYRHRYGAIGAGGTVDLSQITCTLAVSSGATGACSVVATGVGTAPALPADYWPGGTATSEVLWPIQPTDEHYAVPDDEGQWMHCTAARDKPGFETSFRMGVGCQYGPTSTTVGSLTIRWMGGPGQYIDTTVYNITVNAGGRVEQPGTTTYQAFPNAGFTPTSADCAANLANGVAVFFPRCNVDFTMFNSSAAFVPFKHFPGGTPGVQPPAGGPITAEEVLGACNNAVNRHSASAGDPVNTSTGNFYESTTDLAISGRGASLRLSRAYNSLDAARNGPLGFGWSHNYAMQLIDNTTSATVIQENGCRTTFAAAGGAYSAAPRVQASLVKNADGTFTFVRRERERFHFTAAGRLSALEDLNGYQTTLAYAPSGELASVTDPAGRALTFTHSAGRITTVSDAAGRSVSYEYTDGNGNLTKVTDVEGEAWTFAYDSSHRLTSFTRPNGGTTENTYDASSRVTLQRDPLDRETAFVYQPDKTTVTDPEGHVTIDGYAYGQLVSHSVGTGSELSTWRYVYDPNSLAVQWEQDPLGRITRYSSDTRGNLLTRIDPLGRRSESRYDQLNNPTVVVDAAGRRTTFSYDGSGNPLSRSKRSAETGLTQTVTYLYGDPAHPGDVTGITDPLNNTWNYSYDSFGNLTAVTAPPTPENPSGNKTVYGYNTATGWQTSVVTPKGNVAGGTPSAFTHRYDYDNFGRPIAIRSPLWSSANPAAHRTVLEYDSTGHLVSQTDGNANTTTWEYNLAGDLLETTRPDATTSVRQYWGDGTLKSRADGAGNTTSYSYDSQSRLKTITTPPTGPCPSGCVTTYGYDAAGNRTSRKSHGGNCDPAALLECTTYSFDAANQLTSIAYSEVDTQDVSFAYDALGRRATMTEGADTSTWTHDSLGRLTDHINSAGDTVGYDYDLADRLTEITYPGGTKTVTRAYDDAGRWTSVTDWRGNTTEFSYDANSNLGDVDYPSGVNNSANFDSADRPMSLEHADGPTVLARFDYGRDGIGQVASVNSAGVPSDTHNFGYSALNQLRSVDSARFGYDAADNLELLGDETVQSFDASNELTETGRISLITTGTAGDIGTSTSTTVALGATASAGDQILLASTQSASNTVTTPTGFTVVGSYQSSAGLTGTKTVLFRRTATGGEQNLTVAYPSLFPKSVVAVVYRGVDPTDPIDAIEDDSASGASSVAIASLTAAERGEKLVLFAGATGNPVASGWSGPTSMTLRAQKADAPLTALAALDEQLVPAAATGSRTVTFGSTAELLGVMVTLRPAATIYTYDNHGNRVSVTPPGGPATAMTYDQENRLTGYGAAATYSYDASGVRTAKTVAGQTNEFTWDTASGIPLLLSDGAADYVYGPGGQVLERIVDTDDIAFVGADSAHSAAALDVTVGLPAAIQAGDVILAAATHPRNTGSTAPAAYSALGTFDSPANGPASPGARLAIYAKRATGTETSVTVSFDGLYGKTVAAAVYRNVDEAHPLEPISTASNGTGGNIELPEIDASLDGERLVLIAGATNEAATLAWTTSASMTNRTNAAGALAATIVADEALPTSGPTGTRTASYAPGGLGPSSSSSTIGPHVQSVGVLLALKPEPDTLWYHHDQLGSVRMLTDDGGLPRASYTYDPYGRTIATTGDVVQPFGFAGEYHDVESGLLHLRRRQYDPSTGQFLTRDPLAGATGQRYSYAAGNPINSTDPLGLFCVGDFCTQDIDPTDGLKGLANFGVGFTNAALGTNIKGYCGEGLSWSTNIGSATFYIESLLAMGIGSAAGASRAPKAARVADDLVPDGPTFIGFADSPPMVVPAGAAGPTLPSGPGMQFTGGAGGPGLNSRVTGVRVMDATAHHARRAMYMNAEGQTVNPLTGQTVLRSDPWAHLPW